MRKTGLIAAIGDFWARLSGGAAVTPPPKSSAVPGTDTARLLDNFEQRFAELKARKPSATVLADLYELGVQLEVRGRAQQATAVYRHLSRLDNTYKDVAGRLKRLMDTERAKPKPPLQDPNVTAPNLIATPAGKAV